MLQPPPPGCSTKLRRTRIALARRPPAQAAAKRGLRLRRPSGESQDTGAPTGAGHYRYFIRDWLSPALKTIREIRERPKARLKIDKIMAVKTSDFVARTPPVRTALRFRDEVVGLFICNTKVCVF